MKKYIFNRIIQMIPIVFIVSILSFLIIKIAPGDPINMYITPEMTEYDIEVLREQLGLNGSVLEQYLGWLKGVLSGNMGFSLNSHLSVSMMIKEKLPATILLMGCSVAFSIIVSIPLGLLSGYYKNTWFDKIVGVISYIGISIPSFWFAIILIIVFSLNLGWLPSVGMRSIGVNTTIDLIRHLIMPTIVLSFGNVARYTRYIRANTITQLQEEYVITAISKGATNAEILKNHILKNCLLPIITLVGMSLASLVTGSFIVESIFGWPGMGTLGMSAINGRDYPMIMGFTMLSCIILIIGNFISDILYGVVDPRIRRE